MKKIGEKEERKEAKTWRKILDGYVGEEEDQWNKYWNRIEGILWKVD